MLVYYDMNYYNNQRSQIREGRSLKEKVLIGVALTLLSGTSYLLGKIDERDKVTDPYVEKIRAEVLEVVGLDKLVNTLEK